MSSDKTSTQLLSPPEYSEKRNSYSSDLSHGMMTPTTNGSAVSLPTYDVVDGSSSSAPGFRPTRQLQLQTEGYSGLGFEDQRPDPVFIYEITSDGQQGKTVYLSLRFKASSNNCILIHAGDSSETPLCSTTYRIGPFRPPRMSIPGYDEEVTVQGSNWGCLSRKTTMKTPLGTFRWRYGGRKERKAVNASNLLIFELMTENANSDDGWRRVGQLVRSKEFRSEGSSRWASGNGGRLMLDFTPWSDTKDRASQVEVLAVASCMVMLKKEVDNARAAGIGAYNSSVAAGTSAAVAAAAGA